MKGRYYEVLSISIHAPREGSDLGNSYGLWIATDFNPRSPRRERPFVGMDERFVDNFNPRSPRRERQGDEMNGNKLSEISIHAPREGSDVLFSVFLFQILNFNPRSPRRERQPPAIQAAAVALFQSTLPEKGAT